MKAPSRQGVKRVPVNGLCRTTVTPPRQVSLLCVYLVAVAALALVATGCRDRSPEERYVERVCATTLLRAQELLEILDEVRHTRAGPGPEAKGELLGPIERAKRVAQKLGDDLREIPRPETETARRAANYLENFASFAFERMVTEERRVRKLPENPTLLQSIRGLDELEAAFFATFIYVTGAEGAIRQELPELREPFDKAKSCKELDALGTD